MIRPRIEPPGASTSSMEVGEGSQEGGGEIVDTDVEAVGEGKIPVVSEVPDNSGSPYTGVAEAVAAAVTAAPAESPVMIAPPATAIAVARKRAAPIQEIAPSDDELILQESKSEKAPPYKKSRPAEVRFLALQNVICLLSLYQISPSFIFLDGTILFVSRVLMNILPVYMFI